MLTPKPTLSLITYNIHKGFGVASVRFLLPEMKEALATINPDFVFLQEVQGAHRRKKKGIEDWPDSTQAEYLAEEIWPHSVYAKHANYAAGHHGNAILSKYPMGHHDNIHLSNIQRASRGFIHAQVPVQLERTVNLHLVCVHLGLFEGERRDQCRALILRIKEKVPEQEPLIIAGDFNDWREHISSLLAEELGMEEAFVSVEGQHARSFPAIHPALCVDRVYFRGLEVLDVQCLQGKPWRMLSDHLPLLARFSLKENECG